MSLDDSFAAIDALGEAAGAYTTGTPANQALVAAVNAVAVTLASGIASAEATVVATPLTTAANILIVVSAMQYAAQARAAAAWMTGLQANLGRP